MEITNEIKAKVFSQYLPYFIDSPMRLAFLSIIERLLTLEQQSNHRIILLPITSMSNEDALVVANIFGGASHLSEEGRAHQAKELFITYDFRNKVTTISAASWLKAFQYLLSKGYDLPQLLLGGKTLQEAGIAIYETNEENKNG